MPRERRLAAMLGTSFVFGVGATAAIVALVFATGATFGQRCEAMYPGAAATVHERCVTDLEQGRPHAP